MTNNYAGFWKRLIAWAIDVLIPLVPILLLANFAAQSKTLEELWQRSMLILLYLFFPLLGLAIILLPLYYFGGTFGKLITGLRITNEDGKPLTFLRIFFRQTVGYLFASSAFSIGFLAIAKDSKKQGWHDKAVGSLVVETHKLWPLGLVVLTGLLGFYGYMLNNTWHAASYGPLRFQLHDLAATVMEDTEKSSQTNDQSNYYPESTLSQEWQKTISDITALQQNGQFAKASQQAQTLLNSAQTQNEKAVAHKMLGAIAYQQRNYISAKTHGQMAVELYPNYVGALEYLALTEIVLGNIPNAVQHAQKAVSLMPKDPSTQYTMAMVLFAQKDTAKAKEAIKKAIALDPQNSSYKQVLSNIESAITATPTQAVKPPTSTKKNSI